MRILIAIVLAVAAVVISWERWSGPIGSQDVTVVSDIQSIRIEELGEAGSTLDPSAKVWAVAVVPSTVCPPCIAEIEEYFQILASDFGEAVGRSLWVYTGTDLEYRRFIESARLSIPSAHVEESQEALRTALVGRDLQLLQRLVLVDSETGLVLMNKLLPPNSVSPLRQKRSDLAILRGYVGGPLGDQEPSNTTG